MLSPHIEFPYIACALAGTGHYLGHLVASAVLVDASSSLALDRLYPGFREVVPLSLDSHPEENASPASTVASTGQVGGCAPCRTAGPGAPGPASTRFTATAPGTAGRSAPPGTVRRKERAKTATEAVAPRTDHLRRGGRPRSLSVLKAQLLAVLPAEIVSISPKKYNTMVASMESPAAVSAWALRKAVMTMQECYRDSSGLVLDMSVPGEVIELLAFGAETGGCGATMRTRSRQSAAAAALAELVRRERLKRLGMELGLEAALPWDGTNERQVAEQIYAAHGMAGLDRAVKLEFPLTDLLRRRQGR